MEEPNTFLTVEVHFCIVAELLVAVKVFPLKFVQCCNQSFGSAFALKHSQLRLSNYPPMAI